MSRGRVTGALPLLLLLGACGSSQPTATPAASASASAPSSPSATPQPPAPSQLLFASAPVIAASPAAGDRNTLSWTRTDGSAITTVSAGRQDPSFFIPVTDGHNWSGISSSVLSSSQPQPVNVPSRTPSTAYAVLTKDGSVHPAAAGAAVTTFLTQAAPVPGNARAIFVTNGQLFATVAASDHVDIDRVDLASGQMTTLLTAEPLSSSLYFTLQLDGLSADGQQLSFIAANTTLGGHQFAGLSTVVMNTSTATWNARLLPQSVNDAALPQKPPSGAASGPLRVFASLDGTAAVYDTFGVSGGRQTTMAHEYSLSTSTDTMLATDVSNVALGPSWSPVLWSPDGTKIALSSGEPFTNVPRVIVVDAATGKVVQNPPAPSGQRVMDALGWTSDGNLVYESSAGNSTSDVVTTHVLNVSSGAARDLPAALGHLVAFLY